MAQRGRGRPSQKRAYLSTAVILIAIFLATFYWLALSKQGLRASSSIAALSRASALEQRKIDTSTLSKDFTWHVFAASYNVPFKIALPNPASDHNARVILSNVYEEVLGDVFRVFLAGRCTRDVHVLDIGANLGIFSATSAAFACSVTAVEAQSRLVPYLQQTVAANQVAWGDVTVVVLNIAVYDKPGTLSIAYYNASRSRSMAMDAESIRTCPSAADCKLETVPVVKTEELITRDNLLVKISVDGPEAVITKALLPALRKHRVESILIDVCPSGWHEMISKSEGLGVLRSLMEDFGYDLIILNQADFGSYKKGFLDRLHRIEGVFRPRAYVVPPTLLDELFDDKTTYVNCKNVVFTDLALLMSRFAQAGGILVPPTSL
jgi:FkbM family methyltransferase